MYGGEPGRGGGGGGAGVVPTVGGIGLLPNTGSNDLLMVVSITSIVVGAIILLSTAARFVSKRAYKA